MLKNELERQALKKYKVEEYILGKLDEQMKEYDQVELIVEKERYIKDGVHKGMKGWVCDGECVNGTWLVCFDEDETFDVLPVISVKESDMKVIYSAEVSDEE